MANYTGELNYTPYVLCTNCWSCVANHATAKEEHDDWHQRQEALERRIEVLEKFVLGGLGVLVDTPRPVVPPKRRKHG